jgi:hypothetical protein
MDNLDYINDIVPVKSTEGKDKTTISYIKWVYEKPEKVRKELRDLKLGELVEGEDNSEKIQELQSGVPFGGFSDDSDAQVGSLVVQSKTIKLNNKIRFSSHASASYEANSHLRDETLKEIRRVSKRNKPGVIKKAQTTFDIHYTKNDTLDVFSRRILSKILICGNFIAMNGRIGPGNTAIMSLKMAHYVCNSSNVGINFTHSKKSAKNPFFYGTLSSMNVFIDDSLNNTIIVSRLGNDDSQINTNIGVFYDYDSNKNELSYSIEEIGDTEFNYIEFDVTGLKL